MVKPLCPNDSFLFKKSINPNPEGKNGNLLEIGNWKSIFLNSKYYTHTTHTIHTNTTVLLCCEYDISEIWICYVLIMYGMYGMVCTALHIHTFIHIKHTIRIHYTAHYT